ncbi:MAG TPA: hypothetical protein VFW66_10915 [Gemmatimonadales bacterium]|nr:hypothetical protein [Gemmatimonadales bacterium]
MAGHVFHPGHQAFHGVTVVLEARGGITYIGRFDTQDAAGVHLLDVARHQSEAGTPARDEFVRRSAAFGVRGEHKHLVVLSADVISITPLGSLGV